MKAREVMTRDVITVGLGAQVTDIASLLVRRRIGAVPVVTRENHVVGIVSVSDLFRRPELGTEPRRSWLLELFADRDALAREFTRLHGQTAADIMSRPVIAVSEDADLVEVARVLDTHKIKRVTVLHGHVLAGIISRNDIVRGLIRQEPAASVPTASDDNAIRVTLLTQMRRQPWIDATYVSVVVTNGIIELSGMVDSEEQRGALRVLARGIPGVRKISDHLYIRPVALAGA